MSRSCECYAFVLHYCHAFFQSYKVYSPSGGYNYDYGSSYSSGGYNYDYGSSYSSGTNPEEVEPDFECKPLVLFDPLFWDNLADEQKGWHAAWQAAAALGAIGTAVGAVTLVLLLKSTCFEMKKRSVS